MTIDFAAAGVHSPFERIRQKLAAHPDWTVVDTGDAIRVLARDVDGFDVAFTGDDEGYIVFFAAWHQHFARDAVEHAMNCFAFGLCGEARLRVHARGGKDYRWTLEWLQDGAWRRDSTTCLLFFPYWRRRSVRYLRNAMVPASGG